MSHPPTAGDRDPRPAPDSSAPTRPDYEAIAERWDSYIEGRPLEVTFGNGSINKRHREVAALLARCQWLEGQVAKQATVIEEVKALVDETAAWYATDRPRISVNQLRRALGESL